jgi:hypothetical protein
MDHTQAFMGSYWMLQSGKCLRHIALAARHGINGSEKMLTKHNF